MSRFKQASDEKMSDLKRVTEISGEAFPAAAPDSKIKKWASTALCSPFCMEIHEEERYVFY